MSYIARVSCTAAVAVRNVAFRQALPATSSMVGGQSVRFFAAPSKKVKKDEGDSSKKGTSKKNKDGGEEQAEIDAIYKFIHASLDAKEFKVEYSEEEAARRAAVTKEYQRQCFKYEHAMNKDLSNKIWLQQEALRAMPEELRAHAETVDPTPPPQDRPWPKFDTPAIKGFNPQDYVDKKKNDNDADLI